MAKSPMDGWTCAETPRHELRILEKTEEPALLDACETPYGEHLRIFVAFILETWGRRSEVIGLRWKDGRFDDYSVCFRGTKSHEDRFVTIAPTSELWPALRRLKAKTLQDGGPFTSYGDNSDSRHKWVRAIAEAGIPRITFQDLRRTGITRALLNGCPFITVQKLAGHKSISTTTKYYVEVSKQDLRDAVVKLHRRKASGS